jgi:hypothetical protein
MLNDRYSWRSVVIQRKDQSTVFINSVRLISVDVRLIQVHRSLKIRAFRARYAVSSWRSLTLSVEAQRTFETPVTIYHSTQRHILCNTRSVRKSRLTLSVFILILCVFGPTLWHDISALVGDILNLAPLAKSCCPCRSASVGDRRRLWGC